MTVQDWGVAALERAAEGLCAETAVHVCYGYGIETSSSWSASTPTSRSSSSTPTSSFRARTAGMAPVARGAALDKLGTLATGADILRAELVGTAVPAAH